MTIFFFFMAPYSKVLAKLLLYGSISPTTWPNTTLNHKLNVTFSPQYSIPYTQTHCWQEMPTSGSRRHPSPWSPGPPLWGARRNPPLRSHLQETNSSLLYVCPDPALPRTRRWTQWSIAWERPLWQTHSLLNVLLITLTSGPSIHSIVDPN